MLFGLIEPLIEITGAHQDLYPIPTQLKSLYLPPTHIIIFFSYLPHHSRSGHIWFYFFGFFCFGRIYSNVSFVRIGTDSRQTSLKAISCDFKTPASSYKIGIVGKLECLKAGRFVERWHICDKQIKQYCGTVILLEKSERGWPLRIPGTSCVVASCSLSYAIISFFNIP